MPAVHFPVAGDIPLAAAIPLPAAGEGPDPESLGPVPGGIPLPPGAASILRAGAQAGTLTHLEHLPGAPGRRADWPAWVPPQITAAFEAAGISRPWQHQALAAEHAAAGQNVILATSPASGKSLGYLLPALTRVAGGGTALYLAPTRALAADQLRMVTSLQIPGLRAAVVDGDTPAAARSWARARAGYLLTTPDMLHHSLLPRHSRWDGFFRRLSCVIVDECHAYRGVFGSHVAQVLRRLRRVAAHHAQSRSAAPPGSLVFVLASATVSEPQTCARLLTGLDAVAVTADTAPRAPLTLALWQPALTGLRGERGAPLRRPAPAEAAEMLAGLLAGGARALAFVRSRRSAEAVALAARKLLAGAGSADLAERVAAYRSGYLAQDRRALEDALRAGQITGLAATTALELGVNIAGLDTVLITGWPGTRAGLWQQAGRAGRDGRGSLAVLIARDDPLDTYLVHHPDVLLNRGVEATVLDPGNPYVLAPHLCAAAAELPLTQADLAMFGPPAEAVASDLTRRGMLRARSGDDGPRWCWGRGTPACASLRGTGGLAVRIVEAATGRLVGTVDEPSAHVLVHTGAVYPHQGEMYVVTELDLSGRVALVEQCDPGYTTFARELTGIEVAATVRSASWGEASVCFGDVLVRRQVVSYTRRRAGTAASGAAGRPGGDVPLDLPPRTLRTRAVWWTISPGQRARLAGAGVDLAGAAHAAEHASIGLLPLVAACDRWDVGGVSAQAHPATGGRLTVFVYDGHDGGAGFAERGFRAARDWLAATAQAIACCECTSGCPSCIQSPKCGNGNEPLSKRGAVTLLECLLGAAAAAQPALKPAPACRKPAQT